MTTDEKPSKLDDAPPLPKSPLDKLEMNRRVVLAVRAIIAKYLGIQLGVVQPALVFDDLDIELDDLESIANTCRKRFHIALSPDKFPSKLNEFRIGSFIDLVRAELG